MKPSNLFPVLLALSALTITACGGSQATESDAVSSVSTSGAGDIQLVTIKMQDIYFGETNDNVDNPPVWNVDSGTPITFELDNAGALEHSWVVLKAGEAVPVPFNAGEHDDIIIFDSGIVTPGAEEEVTFIPPVPGEYNVVCTVSGHAGLMQGRLVVTG